MPDVGIVQPKIERKPLFDAEAQALITQRRNLLDYAGFVHTPADQMQRICQKVDLGALQAAADTAPVDEHDHNRLRHRYYRKAVYQPYSGTLIFLDSYTRQDGTTYVPYLQSASINTEQGGKERRFATLPDYLDQDPALLQIVRATFEMLPGDLIDRRRLQEVGIHLTKLWSDGRQRAQPSPPHIHTDGEKFTQIVLISRENVTPDSATNYVAERDCRGKQPQECDADQILARVTMRTPWEAVLVDDSRVSHHVSAVQGANGQPGWRTSLLVDFSTLHPERTT